MSSLRKLESARLNGAKSKGPATPEGNAIVSMNALRHGLAAQTVVLGNESRDRFNSTHDAYLDEFEPRTNAERDAVEEMAIAKWRQRRYWGTEAATLDLQMDKQAKEITEQFDKTDETTLLAIAFQTLSDNSNALRLLDRYLAGIRRDYDRAFQRLLDLRILNSPSTEAEENPILRNKPNPIIEHPVERCA